MPIDHNTLYSAIKSNFPNADLELTDTVGDNNHYELKITTEEFSGLSKIEQHRLVHKVLKEWLGADLHALSIKTYIKKE
ncbi:BolA/IbaG family iron-sulfur metabolism protein [Candidatus Bandiella euplotis]|uniref:Transcriptional regulator BolA n=1 Tax=Candidatus Bandiella euplotis TaxID=1664265 RepID=A0ABZ0UL54_9RICK|nr:BolA/IbaG family iron-sulfur metabolism protein [Candidatus Bandiella woodruffii]WPX96851.1 transcriptional regulator BolA [Candidatus Bandiella woodruffii]